MACLNICPQHCITCGPDAEGFFYPVLNAATCTHCQACVSVCPVDQTREMKAQPQAFAACCKDETVRFASSSGGIFNLLAAYTLSNNGIVFGARLGHDMRVVHSCAHDANELVALMGSKYVQSQVGDSLLTAKRALDSGRKVLYSGTPCQINGLLSYLGGAHCNLLTVDLICHGVASPLMWNKYLSHIEQRTDKKITHINFRHKSHGWRKFSMKITFDDGEVYSRSLHEDPFLRGYLDNLYLRPSCHTCDAKAKRRSSDITLGDFWGVQNVLPEFYDDKGCSLVLTNTVSGLVAFKTIAADTRHSEVAFEIATSMNSHYDRSAWQNPLRDRAFKLASTNVFEAIITKCERSTFRDRIAKKVRKILESLPVLV